jgi:L-ascorbate metabolism protein UlaG (beta-lactamase superfamily)
MKLKTQFQIKPIYFRWLGVAGIELKDNRQTLLIDPFLSHPSIRYLFFGQVNPNRKLIKEKIEQAENILVTHAHYDHLMDVPQIAINTGACVYGSANTCQLLKILGAREEKTRLIRVGEKFFLGNIEINVLAARHPYLLFFSPGALGSVHKQYLRLRDYRMDDCYSFFIKFKALKVLVWSSISTQGAIPADVLLLRAVAKQDWYREMLEKVQPKLVIPTHWDDMFRGVEKPIRPFWAPPELNFPPLHRIDLDRFQRDIHQIDPQCKVLIPNIFEPYDLVSEIG